MIVLGDQVRDGMTGLVGAVIAKSQHLYGPEQVCIQPHLGKDGTWQDAQWVDENRVTIIDSMKKKRPRQKRIGS